MRVVILCGLLALTGCTKKSGRVADAAVAPTPAPVADVAPPPATANAAPAENLASLGQSLEQTAVCINDGRVDRRCRNFSSLRKSVLEHEDDDDWAAALLKHARSKRPTALVALTLLDEVSAGEPEQFVEQLWPVVEGAGDASTRTAALRALYGRLTDKHAPQVAKIVDDTGAPAQLRAAATYLIVKPVMKPDAKSLTAKLVKAMEDPEADASFRRALTAAVGKLRHPSGEPALIKLLDDPLLGANATVNLAGFDSQRAFDALWKRLEASARGGPLQVAQVAAIGRLRNSKRFDQAKALKVLNALDARLEQDLKNGDRQARMMQAMVRRHIERMTPKPATPAPEPNAVPPTPKK